MITLSPLHGMPDIKPGDDLASLIAGCLAAQGDSLLPGDIMVVTSKIISKADGLYVATADRADLVLQESTAVVAERRTSTGMTRVVASVVGPVMAGAGIDASNAASNAASDSSGASPGAGPGETDDQLLLLPRDPDASARRLHAGLTALLGHENFGVILSDTSGRPWRTGLTDFALGAAGIQLVDDLRGHADTGGRDLAVTVRNLADAVAAAADLVKGKVDRVPVAVVRGLSSMVVPVDLGEPVSILVRSGPADWFALGQAEAVRAALGVSAGSPESEEAGIASVHPEPLIDRVERSVRVALHGEIAPLAQVRSSADEGAVRLHLVCDDPVLLGRVWARIEIALRGERLDVTTEVSDPREVRLAIREP